MTTLALWLVLDALLTGCSTGYHVPHLVCQKRVYPKLPSLIRIFPTRIGVSWIADYLMLHIYILILSYTQFEKTHKKKKTLWQPHSTQDWAASKSVTAMAPAPMGWSWYPLGVLQGFSSGHKAWILDSHYLLISLVQIWVNWREQTIDFDHEESVDSVLWILSWIRYGAQTGFRAPQLAFPSQNNWSVGINYTT